MAAAEFLDLDSALSMVALAAAAGSGAGDEIPVGAVLVDNWGRILAQTGNGPIAAHDPLGHAEIIAMSKASRRLANYRLVVPTLLRGVENGAGFGSGISGPADRAYGCRRCCTTCRHHGRYG